MRKDEWIKIFIPLIIASFLALGGIARWDYIGIDNLFLALWIGIPIALFVIMLICIKYFSESEIPKIKVRRRTVIGTGERMSDFGLHSITLRFPETNQEFKYAFRITGEGIEDLEFLG
jgi:hypothetical protein